MRILHFIAQHWIRIATTWFLLSVGFVAAWAIYLELRGESDEKRDARRRREAHERTLARYRSIAETYKRRERAKHEMAMSAAVETVREAMQVSNGEAQGRDAEEWDAASNGRRIA